MTKQDVVRDIENNIGSFSSISAIAKYLGKSRASTRQLIDGLDYIQEGKAKKYFSKDIAERLLMQRVSN